MDIFWLIAVLMIILMTALWTTGYFNEASTVLMVLALFLIYGGLIFSAETREEERHVIELIVGENVKVMVFEDKITTFNKGIEINNDLKVYYVERKNAFGFWLDNVDRVEVVH